MLIKFLILAILAAIIVALGSAVFALLGPRRERARMARALTWRVGLSVTLFLLLMAGFATGAIRPHAIAAPQPPSHSQ